MSESLGTARIDVAVDLTQMLASIQQAKGTFSTLSTESQGAFQSANQSVKGVIESLLRYNGVINKSQDEIRLMRAVWRGAGTDVVSEIAGMIAAQRQLAQFDLASKKAAENDAMREQQRVVAALTQQFHALEAAEEQASQFALAQKKQDETNFLREQQRVVAALTQQFHALEAAENEAARGHAFVASLQQQANAIGKTRAELLQLQAAEMGVTKEAAPFIAKLREQERALGSAATKFNEYGLSAKQTQLALRQVPAQITDIVVSLQGGSAPLTVLLQQGGQLRDLFGGIRPAVSALAGALRGLINPYTLLAAAVAGTVLVYAKMEQQSEKLTHSLIMSGRQAEITTEQMLAMADSFDELDGITANKAAEALTVVATNGAIATANLQMVTQAAIQMQQATGQALDATTQQFADLAKDPVGASLRLTETMRYLTRETLNAMQAAIDQGDTVKAAQIAQEAYADTIQERGQQVRESLGLISGLFRDIKEGSGEAWDAVIQGMEDADRKAKESFDLMAKLKGAFTFGFGPGAGFAVDDALKGRNDNLEATKVDVTPVVDPKAAREFEALRQSNLTGLEKLNLEIAKIRDTGTRALIPIKEINEQIAAAQARYDETRKKPTSTTSLDNAAMREQMQAFKDQLAQEQTAIQNSRGVLQAEFGAKLVTIEDYYARQRELMSRDTAAQETALQGQISVLRQRNATGKEAIDVQRQLGQLEAQLANVRAKAVAEGQVLAIQEKSNLDARKDAITDYARAQDLATLAVEQQWDATVDSISMGEQEYAQKQRLAAITRKYADEIERLAILKARDPANAAVYDAQAEAAKKAADAQTRAVESGYERMKGAQSDWQNGVIKGWADWKAQAEDVAGQIARVTTGAFDRMTDAVTEFVLTGKFNFKSLLADILAEIAKFLAKQAVLNFLKMFAGGWSDGGMGGGVATMGGSGGVSAGFAKGGVFENSPSLHAYRNQIVDTPTPFRFAKGGQFGEMGEKGPEAIMPLDRSSDGTLGVRLIGGGAAGGGAGMAVGFEFNIVVNSDGSSSTEANTKGKSSAALREFADSIRGVVQQELDTAMLPNGKLWRAGVGA